MLKLKGLRALHGGEEGQMAIVMLLTVMAIIAVTALSLDVGAWYFDHRLAQNQADAAIARWNAEHEGQRAVTTVEDPAEWYPAEDYHQEYWEGEGQRNPYCLAVIPPKLQKLRKSFAARLKSQAADS